jgi:hypothetical protein
MAESQGVGTRATRLVYRKIPKRCKGSLRFFILPPIGGDSVGVSEYRHRQLLVQLLPNLPEVDKPVSVLYSEYVDEI